MNDVKKLDLVEIMTLTEGTHLKNHMAHYASHISTINHTRRVFAYYRSFKKPTKKTFAAAFDSVILPDNVNFVSDDFLDGKQKNLYQMLKGLQVQDILLVKSFDQLASDLSTLSSVLRKILSRDVELFVLDYGQLKYNTAGMEFIDMLERIDHLTKQMHSNMIKIGKIRQKKQSKHFYDGRPRRKIDDRYRTIYLALTKHKMSYQQAADTFNVSKSTVYRIKKQIEQE